MDPVCPTLLENILTIQEHRHILYAIRHCVFDGDRWVNRTRRATYMALEELLDGVLLVFNYNEKSLESKHGSPLRMLVPKLYFWKSPKWLSGLESMAENKPSFCGMYGYHVHGDPWTEERFVGPAVNKRVIFWKDFCKNGNNDGFI